MRRRARRAFSPLSHQRVSCLLLPFAPASGCFSLLQWTLGVDGGPGRLHGEAFSTFWSGRWPSWWSCRCSARQGVCAMGV